MAHHHAPYISLPIYCLLPADLLPFILKLLERFRSASTMRYDRSCFAKSTLELKRKKDEVIYTAKLYPS